MQRSRDRGSETEGLKSKGKGGLGEGQRKGPEGKGVGREVMMKGVVEKHSG